MTFAAICRFMSLVSAPVNDWIAELHEHPCTDMSAPTFLTACRRWGKRLEEVIGIERLCLHRASWKRRRKRNTSLLNKGCIL